MMENSQIKSKCMLAKSNSISKKKKNTITDAS